MSGGLAGAARAWVAAVPPSDDTPAWLAERRAAAVARLDEEVSPTRRDEDWRFTPVDRLADGELSPVADPTTAPAMAERWLGRVTRDEAGHTGLFVDMNTVLFDQIDVARASGGDDVEHACSLDGSGTGSRQVRRLYVAEQGSRLRILERYDESGAGLTNAVTEVIVGPGAVVDHVRVVVAGTRARHMGTVAVRVERDGTYRSHVVALGGRLSRLDLDVALDGRGASCELDGLYVGAGSEYVDHHTFIDHRVPDGTSIERYKGVLAGEAVGVFDGRVRIRPDAQRSDVAQENRNLLLSDGARVHTKPSLVIEADDVKAAHGATVGQIDQDALYYLRSRGLGPKEARVLLLRSFVSEVLPEALAEELLDLAVERVL